MGSVDGTPLRLTQLKPFTKCPDVWYEDGSLVIVAETLAFRVHTSIMAANCEIFKDMASIPQPKDGVGVDEEIYEHCPVLRLQDSATDMRHFLGAVYNFSYLRTNSKNKFPVVAAVMRLGTKYQAPLLRRRAVDIIHTTYPCTLADWDRRSSQRLLLPFEGEVQAVIALAVEIDSGSFLPAAYYATSEYPITRVLSGLKKTNLKIEDQLDVAIKFAAGKEKLREAEIRHLLAFLKPDFTRTNCESRNDREYLQYKAAHVLHKTITAEPYQKWCSEHPSQVGRTEPGDPVCKNCRNAIEASIKRGREKIWELLPSLFDLPEWGILMARDEAFAMEEVPSFPSPPSGDLPEFMDFGDPV